MTTQLNTSTTICHLEFISNIVVCKFILWLLYNPPFNSSTIEYIEVICKSITLFIWTGKDIDEHTHFLIISFNFMKSFSVSKNRDVHISIYISDHNFFFIFVGSFSACNRIQMNEGKKKNNRMDITSSIIRAVTLCSRNNLLIKEKKNMSCSLYIVTSICLHFF